MLVVVFSLVSSLLLALPYGFGKVGKRGPESELRQEGISLYFDAQNPGEAKHTLKALLVARKSLEKWLDTNHDAELPVIMSHHTSKASFANLITDAIELQTLGQGSRDLAWHELVHTMMYTHMENILGPAGSVFHMMWMPAWFIEGLAESLSFSAGSSIAHSMERYHAIKKSWPSFASLHNLYSAEEAHRGYVISGMFVTYLLKVGLAEHLPALLRDFKEKTMPWHWPLAMLPINKNNLPLDFLLSKYLGKNGVELYGEYQRYAEKKWSGTLAKKLDSGTAVRVEGSKLYGLYSEDSTVKEYELHTDGKYLVKKTLVHNFSDDLDGVSRATFNGKQFFFEKHLALKGERYYKLRDLNGHTYFQRKGRGDQLRVFKNELIFRERIGEVTRICRFIDPTLICTLEERVPVSLKIVGSDDEKIVVEKRKELMNGSMSELVDITNLSLVKTPLHVRSYLAIGAQKYLLIERAKYQYIMSIDSQFSCLKEARLDHPTYLAQAYSNQFLLSGYFGYSEGGISLVSQEELSWSSCQNDNVSHMSPLLASIGSDDDLKTAVIKPSPSVEPVEVVIKNKVSPAKKRYRHVLSVPWLGGDSDGLQIALLSVPLMDHMQDVEVQAFLGYGIASNYPNTAINLRLTPYWPEFNFSLYREQAWNGKTKNRSAFVDVLGLKGSSSWYLFSKKISIKASLKSQQIKQYIGPAREGQEFLFGLDVLRSVSHESWQFYQKVKGRLSPDTNSSEFDYQSVGLLGGVAKSFDEPDVIWNLSAEGARTFGEKRRELQQYYIPYRTTIPGEGIQKARLGLFGSGGLFHTQYGDRMLHLKSQIDTPIIENVDHLLGIIYFDSLTFTQYVNYGNAWYEESKEKGLLLSHGYNVDANFDVKGVRLHAGSGVGQVWADAWQVYMILSFDAIF